MPADDLVMRLGGESGEGIVTLGEILARIAARAGFEIYTFRTYPAEIRGGHVLYQMRVSTRPLTSQGDRLDVLVALNQEAYDLHREELHAGSVLIHDSSVQPAEGANHTTYPLPLSDLAQAISFSRGRNIIAAGAVARLLGLSAEHGRQVVERQLGRRAGLLEQNLQALEAGYRYAAERFPSDGRMTLPEVEETQRQERLVLSGNQALALGALAAGCCFFAGYPITPATGIMEFLAGELPKVGGTLVQAEDEMAALAMVIGASFSGQQALTATSGPGLALMIELLGLASMTEVPLVIVNVQRAGPSTGMPTKTGQGDLFLALLGGHDEAPRFVLAPTSVEDCFYQMVQAFSLAERYQTPAIVLSDQSLSMRLETVPPFHLNDLPQPERLRPPRNADGRVEDYRRYEVTENGVSPMALPGMPGGQYTAEGLEHLPSGAPSYDPRNHEEMMRKRFRKLRTALAAAEDEEVVARRGAAQPEIAVLCWGSTAGAVWEAVDQAQQEGIAAGALAVKLLSPLPEAQIQDFVASARTVLVSEENYSGQFAHLLRATLGLEVQSVTRYDGVPFTSDEVLDEIRKANHAQ
ncbi:MAG: 2-oxoacid:acceptor oxidoreductase subunit alpha [Chloroflexi bacterium]|nr:2-oxoacid:acceptor oxidoreductase subunit alpha [Chloroflexota bacterium]